MTEQKTLMTLNDFNMIVGIIDVCSERGSFKGSEILTVGTLREKLVAFVKENSAPVAEETVVEDKETVKKEKPKV